MQTLHESSAQPHACDRAQGERAIAVPSKAHQIHRAMMAAAFEKRPRGAQKSSLRAQIEQLLPGEVMQISAPRTNALSSMVGRVEREMGRWIVLRRQGDQVEIGRVR